MSDVDDRSGTRRTYENHPGDELAYKLLHNSRILLKITYLLSIKAMSAATSKRIMQTMYLFEWLEKTEPKFAAILFITFFFYPFRGFISEAKICGLQIRWFGSIPVFFKNADLFDQCQKIRDPDRFRYIICLFIVRIIKRKSPRFLSRRPNSPFYRHVFYMEPTTGNVPDNPYRLLTAQNLHFIYQLIYNMKVQNRKLESILRPKKGAKISRMNLWLSFICSWEST